MNVLSVLPIGLYLYSLATRSELTVKVRLEVFNCVYESVVGWPLGIMKKGENKDTAL